ncbi:MAG: hypothetical protein Q9159_000836 [Coniocarpon cinnabarinum]
MGKTHRKSSPKPHHRSSTTHEEDRAHIRKCGIKPDFQIDGRKLEGGGQLLRVALCLAALTGKSVAIDNIRGNRTGSRGLKNQHLACVEALAEACNAYVVGARLGSQDLLFAPEQGEASDADLEWATCELRGQETKVRRIVVDLPTPGASTLILQALLPFFLFRDSVEPIVVSVRGATHTTSSPSIDYIDHVLLPNLRAFGLPSDSVKRLSLQEQQHTFTSFGNVDYLVQPVTDRSQRLHAPSEVGSSIEKDSIVIHAHVLFGSDNDRSNLSDAVSSHLLNSLNGSKHITSYNSLHAHVSAVGSPSVEERTYDLSPNRVESIPAVEETKGSHTIYTLLVAAGSDGTRLGEDSCLSWNNKGQGVSSSQCERAPWLAVTDLERTLDDSRMLGMNMDAHMRDQVVVFLGLLGGRVNARDASDLGKVEEEQFKTETRGPYGLSLHAETAIWITKMMLGVEFDADRAGVEQGWLSKQGGQSMMGKIGEESAKKLAAAMDQVKVGC